MMDQRVIIRLLKQIISSPILILYIIYRLSLVQLSHTRSWPVCQFVSSGSVVNQPVPRHKTGNEVHIVEQS